MSLILPAEPGRGAIFVGGESAARCGPTLEANHVVAVLNCTGADIHAQEARGGPRAHCSLGLLDSVADVPSLQAKLRKGVDFIEEHVARGESVLVHCHRGISRSCTLVIAYLVAHHGATVEAAFERVRLARRVCDPNLAYMCSLHEFARTCQAPSRSALAPDDEQK